MSKTTEAPPPPQAFRPDEAWQAELSTNRAGQLTRKQALAIRLAALGSSLGFGVALILCINVVIAFGAGLQYFAWTLIPLFAFFLLSFGYLLLTLYFNTRRFLPDLFSRNPVKQARGKLEIRKAARHRPVLPFSYIVGDYSFAPFEVPYEVPMEKGRAYVVYYAEHSRLFLNIEPADWGGD
jgi:apolipoprotein N-acyltransferase